MTIDLTGDERRLTLRLLSYWEKKRAGRPMPREQDIDPADIADLWEYCFMVAVSDIGKSGYGFMYLGRAIEELYRSGLPADEERGPIFPDVGTLALHYKEVIETASPHVHEGEFTNPHGDIIKFRQALVPLGDGNEVKVIFGGMRFLRVYSYR